VGRPLYVDLDSTLIDSDVDLIGNVTKIHARPGAGRFLEKLSGQGDLFLLTHAMRDHVRNAFRVLGKPSKLFLDVISREDMAPIIEQVDYLLKDVRLTAEERGMLYQEISPIAPRGYIFDDQAVGSYLYLVKTATVGARPKEWVQVKAFQHGATTRNGLENAYQEYLRRAMGPHTTTLAGRRPRHTG